jgi:hypothetical protein
LKIRFIFCFKFAENPSSTSFRLKQNEYVPLIVPNERQSAARLSVIEEQDFKRRQEFSVEVSRKHKIFFIFLFLFRLEMFLKQSVSIEHGNVFMI